MSEWIRRWRSLLYVPADVERFVAKAGTRGADAIILDLEDGVAPANKAAARSALGAAVPALAGAGADILVRINLPLTLAVEDLKAAVVAGVAGLVIPKVESAAHLNLLSEAIADIEAERGLPVGAIRFLPIIESIRGFAARDEIAAADPRNVALSLGSEDFAHDAGAEPSDEFLLAPKQAVALAARAARLMPIGLITSIAGRFEPGDYRASVERARRFGFVGAACTHPDQVPLLNQGFGPSVDEVDVARRLVAAFDAAQGEGRGAIAFDGRMVDAPVAARARALLQQAETLGASEVSR